MKVCSHKLEYSERFDAKFCCVCDEWKERKCEDEKCFFCLKRPDKPRKKNYKPHACTICDRKYQSVRSFSLYCSKKCKNYSNTKKYYNDRRLGLKIDPHNPENKKVLRRILPSK